MAVDLKKLESWVKGWQAGEEFPDVFDADLTDEELMWLENRVEEVIRERTFNTVVGSIVHAPAKGLQ